MYKRITSKFKNFILNSSIEIVYFLVNYLTFIEQISGFILQNIFIDF